jgi:hypothetical protein
VCSRRIQQKLVAPLALSHIEVRKLLAVAASVEHSPRFGHTAIAAVTAVRVLEQEDEGLAENPGCTLCQPVAYAITYAVLSCAAQCQDLDLPELTCCDSINCPGRKLEKLHMSSCDSQARLAVRFKCSQ